MDITLMDIGARPTNPTPGQARFNTATNHTEVWDGANWMPISAQEIRDVTLAEMVEAAEDEITLTINERYTDNATIQDAFREWEEANERFKVVLALAEMK